MAGGWTRYWEHRKFPGGLRVALAFLLGTNMNYYSKQELTDLQSLKCMLLLDWPQLPKDAAETCAHIYSFSLFHLFISFSVCHTFT